MAKGVIKRFLKFGYLQFETLFFNPVLILKRWRGIPVYLMNVYKYGSVKKEKFKLSVLSMHPVLADRYENAGFAGGHYFFQDLWAAEYVFHNKISALVDIGSRVDGFVAHVLPYCKVTYVDIREINSFHFNFSFKKGSILDLQFESNSLNVITCLHVIEHIGLGRYGDPIDPDGYVKAAKEMMRVVKPGGILLLGTPVGKEGLFFDAHRVFAPDTITALFTEMSLIEFSLIDDAGTRIIKNADFSVANACKYGCGLFVFQKN